MCMMKKMVLVLLVSALFLPGIGYAVPGFMLARMGTMEGQVFVEGKPAKSVLLAFFMVNKGLPPISAGGMGRIPDMIDWAGPDGKFKVQLLEGSYYLGILFRPLDARPGPPRKGEKFYFANDGQGKLRRLAIADFQKISVGRVDGSLPSLFKEVEDHFTVEGVVLRGEGANEPLADAMVLAKRSPEAMRPEYISAVTDKDGRFSIKLPPAQTFYLVARASITGAKPNPGEDIGKLGVDKDTAKVPEVNFSGAPSKPSEDFLNKAGARGQVNDTAVPVTGKKGEVISGLKIHMFKMPDSQAIKEARLNAAGVAGPGMDGSAADGGQKGIEFAENSEALPPAALVELEALVNYLLENKAVRVEIGGFTGSSETAKREKAEPDYQQRLSERRAVAVKDYLQGKGVEGARVSAVGYGVKNDSASGGAQPGKGRVEIKVLEKN